MEARSLKETAGTIDTFSLGLQRIISRDCLRKSHQLGEQCMKLLLREPARVAYY
jgi:hypothetical protein